MSRIPALIDTVIRLKRSSQADLATNTGIHQSNLSKFLTGSTDIRTSSLLKIFESLDISLEEVLESEIEKLIGKKKSLGSVGEAVEVLLEQSDPISAKTFIDSLASRAKPNSSKEFSTALDIVKDYKTKIGSVRRIG